MRVAIVDPSSYSLPYDYYYIKRVSEYCAVDFFGSSTIGNQEFLDHISELPNVSVHKYNVSTKKGLVGLINYLRIWIRLIREQSTFSAIHFQWSVLPLLDLLGFFLIRKRLVVTFHNPVPHDHHKDTYWPYRIIFRLAGAVIFASQYARDRFVESYGVESGKTHVLPHGAMPLAPAYEGRDADETCAKSIAGHSLAFWGLVRPYKGIDFFEPLLADPRSENLEIKILGRWDPCLSGLLERLSGRCRISNDFVPLSEVFACFNERPIFVLPYRDATQSGVLFNLLYHRQLVICTDVGDIGEVMKRMGHEKLLFDRNDLDSFFAALQHANENAEALLNHQSKIVREYYAWNYSGSELEQVYHL